MIELLSTEQAGKALGVTAGTLMVWRSTKRYPLRFVKVGRKIRYREEDLVAFIGELAIGLALVTGILVRPASIHGVIYMLTLLFSANYPGPHLAFWQYFGASREHLVLALCFAAFTLGDSDKVLSISRILQGHRT